MPTLTFHGAAREVTGSCYLVESPEAGRILLDCGMHQGGDDVRRIRKDKFSFRPAQIDCVILSHAHLDHSGLLPKLVHQGFSGPIYCTPATADLLKVLLMDSIGLYERDLERENLRRRRRDMKTIEADYVLKDVESVLEQLNPLPYGQVLPVNPAVDLCFYDAGHILGSAIVELTIDDMGRSRRLVFSGDLGNSDSVLMRSPTSLRSADLVLMESTYGNRDHRSLDETLDQLVDILHRTWRRGGNVMLPAFAVGRTQEILFHLGRLHHAGRLDPWQVFLDSPMAIEVTSIYERWIRLLDKEDIRELAAAHQETLKEFVPSLYLCRTPEESMGLNRIRSGAIIIAGSGMCTGGRIRHHLKHGIWLENNTVIFTGFQAQGTLGRLLVDGARRVRMFGNEFAVRARIETLGGFSAHAGQSQLLEWFAAFANGPRLALVHGEAGAMDTLADRLRERFGIEPLTPERGDTIEL